MEKTVLIADDSPTIRKLISLALKAIGMKVVAVSDGMEALETLPHVDVDLIITDLNMPNIDGFELIRAVREDRHFSRLPIIVLSSEGEENDRRQGLKAGANSYLVKPFVAEKIQYEALKFLR